MGVAIAYRSPICIYFGNVPNEDVVKRDGKEGGSVQLIVQSCPEKRPIQPVEFVMSNSLQF